MLPTPALTVSSYSGQFILPTAACPPPSEAAAGLETNHNFMRLEPALLAVSCERVKQLLGRQLGLTGAWRSRVFVRLFSAEGPDDLVTLTSERFADGWQYYLELPNVIERDKYVRALVQVLLLEQANRGAENRACEVPLWLTEGLTRLLLSASEIEIVLTPPKVSLAGLALSTTNLSARLQSPLAGAHDELSRHPPLTFEELSWPATDALAGEAGEVYRSSAQLLVGELLRFHDGAACIRAMLADLPAHYNWQFAFLRGFEAHFQRLIDVEKWWAVQSLQFASRDLTQAWPVPQSWDKLEEALRTPVEVRTEDEAAPLRADATLQTILQEWDGERRARALNAKLEELELLRLRVARELAPLVQGYCQCLETYLGKRPPPWPVRLFNSRRAFEERLTRETVSTLDGLDAHRRLMRPGYNREVPVPVQARVR